MTKKLLVADDSVTIQKVVNLTFAGEDVAIETASDGELALEKIRSMRPDIVLVDVFLPGRNGYEICAELKNDPELAAIPVVLLVGTFEAFDEAQAARVCYSGRLVKPFDTSELIELVRSLTAAEAVAASAAPAARKAAAASAGGGRKIKSPLVSPRSRESFLGNGRILDLFAPQLLAAALEPEPAPEPAVAPAPVQEPPTEPPVQVPVEEPPPPAEPVHPPEAEAENVPQPAQNPTVIQFPAVKSSDVSLEGVELPEDFVNLVVERVVRRLTPDVIREVAWEVVPELAEGVIRKVLAEKGLPPQSN